MKKDIQEMIEERIQEMEVEAILQADLVETLKTIQVTGEHASKIALQLQQTQAQLQFSEIFLANLKQKYLGNVLEGEEVEK